MENCQYVKFDYETNEIINLLPSIISINPKFAKNVYSCGPEFTKTIESILKLRDIDRILYFVMPVGHKSRIHIDMNTSTNLIQKFSLNLPLTSCDNVIMKWYDKKDNAVEGKILGSHMSSFPILEQADATLTTVGKLNTPMIANVDIWHNVENDCVVGKEEHFISIRFPLEMSDLNIMNVIYYQ